MPTMGKTTWALQDAKSRFSEVVCRVLDSGPQIVTRRGVPTIVMISYSEYHERKQKKETLWEFMRKSPLVGMELDLHREKEQMRNAEI